MRAYLIHLLLATGLALFSGPALGQKKDDRCEEGNNYPRNWAQLEREYVYVFYELCPSDLPGKPMVNVWITTGGKGIALEKWAKDREGAEAVILFVDKKKTYTLYRDLKAIPLQFLKAERRSNVPPETAAQPFMLEGVYLVLLENLTDESAERVKKVFESADTLIKKAEMKVALLYDTPRIKAIVEALEHPLKQK